MNELSLIQKVVIWSLPVLFAITVHEVAHGWVAKRLGDPTAMMLGRLTLNPLKHIDPIGTVVVPVMLLMLGGFIFGWAKPVPVTWRNLRNPKRDMVLVALAGPIANLLMALIWAVVVKIGMMTIATMPFVGQPLIYMGSAGIFINIALMVLNLLPLPPLDGGRVVSGLLPGPLSYKFDKLESYGFFILLGLLATGILSSIMNPPMGALLNLIYSLFNI
ncbi:MAG: site-2 protease family protein [Pseudomonadota bacterium]|nr:site-2 protease family protein [Pseudomonadota bacterium]